MINTQEFKGEHHGELRKFLSGPIQNEVLNITSEHLPSEDQFEGKFQDKIYPYYQIFLQPEEELIEFKGEQQMDPNKFSS